jgi:hypothetical protein
MPSSGTSGAEVATQKPPLFSGEREQPQLDPGLTVQGHHSLQLLCDPSFLLPQSLHSDSTQPPQALMAHHAWTFIIVRSSCEAGSSTKFKTSSERLFVGEWACLS